MLDYSCRVILFGLLLYQFHSCLSGFGVLRYYAGIHSSVLQCFDYRPHSWAPPSIAYKRTDHCYTWLYAVVKVKGTQILESSSRCIGMEYLISNLGTRFCTWNEYNQTKSYTAYCKSSKSEGLKQCRNHTYCVLRCKTGCLS